MCYYTLFTMKRTFWLMQIGLLECLDELPDLFANYEMAHAVHRSVH